MKNIHSFFILFSFTHTSHSQNTVSTQFHNEHSKYVAYYKETWVSDSTNPSVKHTELFRLYIGDKASLFQSTGGYLADSVSKAFKNTPLNDASMALYSSTRESLPRSPNRYKVYKDKASNSIIFCEMLSRKNYAYQDTFPIYKWVITSQTAQIVGYSCQKALVSFRGREYEAWFTREIPVSEGPYKFYGLPGLIVKLHDTRSNYVFELQKFVKLTQETTIELPDKLIMTTRTAIVTGKRDYYANLANMVTSMTNQKSMAPAELEAAKRRIKEKFNNSLEIN